MKAEVLAARLRSARVVNTELIDLYWRVGRLILDRPKAQVWGARVLDRFAADLRRELPGPGGWSRSNLFAMREFGVGLAAGRNWPTACWTIAAGPT